MKLPKKKWTRGRPKKCKRCNKPKFSSSPEVKTCNCGRPTVMTPEVLAKLELAFSYGWNDSMAYKFAGISPDTFYKYCVDNPEFVVKKHELKSKLSMKAVQNIAQEIKNGKIEESKWWLERKCKNEFSVRSEVTGAEGEAIKFQSELDLTKLNDDELRNIAGLLEKAKPNTGEG